MLTERVDAATADPRNDGGRVPATMSATKNQITRGHPNAPTGDVDGSCSAWIAATNPPSKLSGSMVGGRKYRTPTRMWGRVAQA